jgi:ribosomal protein L7/L12
MPKLTISEKEAKKYVGVVHNLAAEDVTIEFDHTTRYYTYTNELVRNFNEACQNGQKFQAIKYLRELTGAGLKASKDFCDVLCADKKY